MSYITSCSSLSLSTFSVVTVRDIISVLHGDAVPGLSPTGEGETPCIPGKKFTPF